MVDTKKLIRNQESHIYHRNLSSVAPFFGGGSFFGIEMSFFVASRWPKSPFWYQDFFFGIENLRSVVQHLHRPLPGINQCMLIWASTSWKLEVEEDLDTEKKMKILDT